MAAAPYVEPPARDGERPRERKRLSVLWRLTALLRPHRARFALAVVMLLLASGTMLVYPQAARFAIDRGMKGKDATELDLIVGGLLLMFLLNAVFVWLRHYSISWLGERVVADLRG